MKKKKSEHFTTKTKKQQNEKNPSNPPTEKADKISSEVNSDLIHRPELQKKKFIHPSAIHESLNTDFNNRYTNTFLQRTLHKYYADSHSLNVVSAE